ncbi:MAG: flagellar basal body P-ring formation chaperone FlgA [Desulfobacterales bacterium]
MRSSSGLRFFVRVLASILPALSLIPAAAAAAPDTSATGPPVIRVEEKVEVNGDPITLGDIARVEAADPDVVEALEGVVVGKAPLAGRQRRLSREYLLLRLKQNRVDPESVRWICPEVVDVRRGSVHITGAEIEMMVRDFLCAAPSPAESDVVITEVLVPEEGVELPKGDLGYDMEILTQRQFTGTQPIHVQFRVNQVPEKKVLVTARMEVMREVVITRAPIARGRMLTEGDLAVQRMNVAGLPPDLMSSTRAALGKQATRYIPAMTVLRSDWIEAPPVVGKGDRVLLVAERGGLRVTALGEVRKKGRLGERIPVMNLDSNKSVFGLLMDARTVKVEF